MTLHAKMAMSDSHRDPWNLYWSIIVFSQYSSLTWVSFSTNSEFHAFNWVSICSYFIFQMNFLKIKKNSEYQLRNDSDYIIPRIHLNYIKHFPLYMFLLLFNFLSPFFQFIIKIVLMPCDKSLVASTVLIHIMYLNPSVPIVLQIQLFRYRGVQLKQLRTFELSCWRSN